MTPRPPIQPLGHGVHVVDSGFVRPRFDAIHLIVEAGRAAIVDTGTRDAVAPTLEALASLGLGPEAVDWIILTHVHLDHAGGAGHLMQRLPNARLAVHPRGVVHMTDPAKLWAGTVAVYGAREAESMYGEPLPVPADRIEPLPDGATLSLAGRRLDILDAPGHARHHVVIRDSATGHLFAGDTFGISYREFDVDGRPFAFPSSTPVQFDPDALRATLRRMLALRPEAILLTHWSQVGDIPRLGATLLRLVDRYEAIARAALAETGPDPQRLLPRLTDDMEALLLGEVRAHGCRLAPDAARALLATDIALNAAGLLAWLQASARVR
jgi:glyoxylase-like metal-dependent hydrolase (beta-lactamase superfamily II)